MDTPSIRTRYAEVFWTVMPPIPLPRSIVEKYNNTIMAITAHEVNVLRHNSTTGNTSAVPCYESYNHHFTAHLVRSNDSSSHEIEQIFTYAYIHPENRTRAFTHACTVCFSQASDHVKLEPAQERNRFDTVELHRSHTDGHGGE